MQITLNASENQDFSSFFLELCKKIQAMLQLHQNFLRSIFLLYEIVRLRIERGYETTQHPQEEN